MPGLLPSDIKTVAVAGVAESLTATDIYTTSVTIRATRTNTDDVYIGQSDVDNTKPGTPPGGSITVSRNNAFSLQTIFVDASVNSEGVDFWYVEQ